MNKHIVNHWWKYVAVAVVALIGYSLVANQGQLSPNKQTGQVASTTENTLTEQTNKEDSMSEYTTTETGLQYKVIKRGAGLEKPTADSVVTVHYHGTLADGTVFDSSRQRGETISFPLNAVIAGWTEGLQLMAVGDTFEFNIPANLAYGDRSPSPLIPAGSDLIFEVELFGIE